MPTGQPFEALEQLCELLQEAHFSARGLDFGRASGQPLAEQLHRIRLLAEGLKAQLAAAPLRKAA